MTATEKPARTKVYKSEIRAQQRRMAAIIRFQEERDEKLRRWHEEAEAKLDQRLGR